MIDPALSAKAEQLLEQLATLLEHPPVDPEHVRAVLADAKAAGLSPAKGYLIALKRHPKGAPLPPHPLAVMPP